MTRETRRLRRLSAICISAAFVVASNSATASSHSKPVLVQSEVAQVITVPVQQSIIEIMLDTGLPIPTASISLTAFNPNDMLFLTRDIFPIVARISQCRVQNDAPANQLLSLTDVVTVQLDC